MPVGLSRVPRRVRTLTLQSLLLGFLHRVRKCEIARTRVAGEMEPTAVVGLCDASFAGARAVLSQVLAAQPDTRWSTRWAAAEVPDGAAAQPPPPQPVFALSKEGGTVDTLAHVEGASFTLSRGSLALVAVNAEVLGDGCVARAAEVANALLSPSGGGTAAHVVLVAALRFTPERGHASKVHVASLAPSQPAGAASPLPAALLDLPALSGEARLRDRFAATLLQLLVARGARVSVLAISSLAVADPAASAAALSACLSTLLGRPCPPDPRLCAQLKPTRYTDALVETNGFFLYT